MWEIEGRELLESGDPYLLPLVAIARSGEDEILEAERSLKTYLRRLCREIAPVPK